MDPTKRQIKKHGNDRWELDFGADAVGKRKRLAFETEAAADAEIARYKKAVKLYGEYWARLPPLERQTTVAILQEIEARGLALTRVWADHQQWSKDAGKQEPATAQPYANAVAEFKRRKLAAGKSPRYVDETVALLMKFGVGRERQNIHEIPPGDLEKWIDGQKSWGLSSRRTNMSLLSSLWEVAIAKGWCSDNIVDRLEPVGKISRVVKIYSNDTVLNLLAAALSNELAQMVIAPLALGLFGCMRPEEVEHEKFGWQYIDLEHSRIIVTPEVAKTGDQRTIRLQPAAVEWLKLAKDLKNPLPPVNGRRLVDACCELIGLDDWIRDGLRKCCATHLRAVYRNDYDVVKDMGNSVRILVKHYAALDVPEAVSLEHWQLTPDKVRKHLKSDKWKQTVKAAAERAAAATAAAEARPKRLASGTARRAG